MWVASVTGWLVTAVAAPFWFDALQSVVQAKGSGPSPNDRKKANAG